MNRIYLDNNATTALAPEVHEAMAPWLHGSYGNAASVHWFGQRARAAVDGARRAVAGLIGAAPNEIVFTSGGTEADNLAMGGAAGSRRQVGKHLITSSIEHPAVLESCRSLQQLGFEVIYLPVDTDGLIDAKSINAAIRPDTALISIMLANNETGTIEPVRQIAQLAKAKNILVHTDAVQAAGKIPINVEELGVDLLSVSAHKFHGPQGIGALYIRKGVELEPQLRGGGQERKRRAGTENVAAIVGFGRAAELARRDVEEYSSHVAVLRDRFEQTILDRIASVRVNGSRLHRIPNTTNLAFAGVEGDALLMALDLEGVAASMGAACSSGTLEPSHVLTAMGLPAAAVRGSVRFSLSKFNSAEEIDRAVEIVSRVVDRIRTVSSESPQAQA